jgi:hypothetical protein
MTVPMSLRATRHALQLRNLLLPVFVSLSFGLSAEIQAITGFRQLSLTLLLAVRGPIRESLDFLNGLKKETRSIPLQTSEL